MANAPTQPGGKLPWSVFTAGPKSSPHTIEVHDADGKEVVSWMGFDRSDYSRAWHLKNARFIVKAANAHHEMLDTVTAPFRHLRGVDGRSDSKRSEP